MIDLACLALLTAAWAAAGVSGGSPWSMALAGSALVLGLARTWQGRWQAAPLALAALLQLGVAGALQPGAWLPASEVGIGLLIALAAWLMWMWPIPDLDAPTGPHAVGLRTLEFALAGGGASVGTRADGRRWIQLLVWHPARPAAGSSARRLRTAAEARALAQAPRALRPMTLMLSHFRLARTHSHDDAPIASGRFPLVVFNHGGAMGPTQNFGLMQELASHGYVVVSMTHPAESIAVSWGDGEITPMDGATLSSMAGKADAWARFATYLLLQDADERRRLLPRISEDFSPITGAMARRWAGDSVAAVDHLMSGSTSADTAELAAHLDNTRLAYAGMSLGGAATLDCCFDDARARAGINLDGAVWSFEHVDRAVPVPFLQLYADPLVNARSLQARAHGGIPALRCLTPATAMTNDLFYEPPSTRGTRSDIVRAALRGAGHMAFTDHVLGARGPVRRLLGIGSVRGRSTQQRINALVLAFLDRHLKGLSDDRLERLLADDRSVVVQSLAPEAGAMPAVRSSPTAL